MLSTVVRPDDPDWDFEYGPDGAGWLPVAGDWDGDGDVTLGLYAPDDGAGHGKFYLRNVHAGGNADFIFTFGPDDSEPLAGDWNGDGLATVGVFESAAGVFQLQNTEADDAQCCLSEHSGVFCASFRHFP